MMESLIDIIERRFTKSCPDTPLQAGLDVWKQGKHLEMEQAEISFTSLIQDSVSDYQIGQFLTYATPEFLSADEIAGFASALRLFASHPVDLTQAHEGIGDTCGTGGDTVPTFNVSTTIMFILCGAGLRIAKHGNRAFTSKCGSADVLEALGVNINLDADKVTKCLSEVKLGFMFAPNFHTATAKVQRIRKILADELPGNLRAKTIFNVLGPLANPANTPWQLLGVYNEDSAEKLANVIKRLG